MAWKRSWDVRLYAGMIVALVASAVLVYQGDSVIVAAILGWHAMLDVRVDINRSWCDSRKHG